MHRADRATFELLDGNGDGKLDLQEFLRSRRALFSVPPGAPPPRAPGAGELRSEWPTAPGAAGVALADTAESRTEIDRAWYWPLLVSAGLASAAAALSPLAARHVEDPARRELLRGCLPKVAFVISWVSLGVAAGCYAQGWTALTSLYVVVQIVTTIGYGDVTMETPFMKVFCAIYVVITLLVITTWVTAAMTALLEGKSKVIQTKLKKMEDQTADPGGPKPKAMALSLPLQSAKLAERFGLFAVFVAAGTVFFALAEGCTCSYGVTKIEGCVEGPTCPRTGGAVLGWVDSFYMSVITLTTVGFGDVTPKSQLGRLLGIPWMLTGVTATAMFLTAFSDMINSQEKELRCLDRISDDIFAEIDEDGSGELSRDEFLTYALLKFDIVQRDMLKQINQMFDIIDTDRSGRLTLEEIRSHFDAPSYETLQEVGVPSRVSAPSAALQARP